MVILFVHSRELLYIAHCALVNLSEIGTFGVRFSELKDNFYLCHLDDKKLFDQNCNSEFQLKSILIIQEQ